VAFFDATLHCSSGSIDFGAFSRFGFCEDGEEHDDPSGCDVVTDACWLAVKVETEFTKLAVELSGERFAEMNALVGE
jgi:hypothetical protein